MQPREGKPQLRLGAGIMIMSPEGKLLIVQQEPVAPVAWGPNVVASWGPVGGALEFDETIEQCAVREAYEESGLHVRLTRLLSVDQFWHGGEFRGVGFVFLAEPDPWPQDVTIPDIDGNTRFLDYRWVTRDEARKLMPVDSPWFANQYWPSDVSETLVRRLDFPE